MQICDVQKIYIPVGWSDTSTHNPRSQWFWYFYTFFLLWAIIWKESAMRNNFWVSKLRRSSCRNKSHQSAPKGWLNSSSASGTGRKMSDGRQRHISKIWQIWHTPLAECCHWCDNCVTKLCKGGDKVECLLLSWSRHFSPFSCMSTFGYDLFYTVPLFPFHSIVYKRLLLLVALRPTRFGCLSLSWCVCYALVLP